MPKIAVFAMTKKGFTVLQSITSLYPSMVAFVVSARDRGIAEDYYDEIKRFCINNGIVFFDRREKFSINTEYSLAVSWRWLINANTSRLIVFHDSLLPRYRGFNPLVSTLINGDNKIGVTAFFASEEYDKGDVIFQAETNIDYPITISQAIEAIQPLFFSAALEISKLLSIGEPIPAVPQSDKFVSYSLWRDEEDYFINWSKPASAIRRMVDAVGYPYKGAASFLEGKLVRVVRVIDIEDIIIENRIPGKVIFVRDLKPIVVCGHGLLQIEELVDESGATLLPLQKFRMRFKGLV